MPPVQVFQHKLRTLGFVQSLASSFRSLDQVAIDRSLIGTDIWPPGLVLGKVTTSGFYRPSAATGTDGSQVAIAILSMEFDTNFDPSTNYGGVAYVVCRDAEVRAEDISYDLSVTTEDQMWSKWAQLLACGIVVRTMGGVQVAP